MLPALRKSAPGGRVTDGYSICRELAFGWGGKALGLRPKPREGLCPLNPHQGWALDAISWVREVRGPTRTLKRHGWPPYLPDPTDRGPGAVPLVGSKGKALAGFGVEPQGFLPLPLPRIRVMPPCRAAGWRSELG